MKKMKLSLGQKMTAAVILVSILLVIVALLISYFNYADKTYNHYKAIASNLAKTAAAQLDPDKVAAYLETMEEDEAYKEMLQNLFKIKNNNDIKFLYVIKIEDNTMKYIMDADDNAETRCELGQTVPVDKGILPYIDHLENGVPAYITSDEKYGWLSLSLEPLINSAGRVVAMVGADISMNEVMADRLQFLLVLCLGMAVTTVIFIMAFVLFVKRYVVRPINQLSAAAGDFVSNRSENMDHGASCIAGLHICTGDEIENLAESVKKMEFEINEYIDNITRVAAEKERIGAELNVAKQIQASLLPCIFPAFPNYREFDIYACMEPAREVGGDFYDFFITGERNLWIVIADVSDKGVAAALFMVIAKTLIKNHAEFSKSPAEVFDIVNDQLCENNAAGMFVTAFLGVLDIESGSFVFANAGHNYPLLNKQKEGFCWLKSKPGLVLAGMEGIRYKSNEIVLMPGDRLFLYTDGVTEALNRQEDLYGDQRLLEIINKEGVGRMNLEELLAYVKKDVGIFADGAKQSDDITMLALEYKNKRNERYGYLNEN